MYQSRSLGDIRRSNDDSRSMCRTGRAAHYAYMTKPFELTTPDVLPVGCYCIDPSRSEVTFKTRHLFGLGGVRGRFELNEGEIHIADPVGGSSARAQVVTASFHTGNSARDAAVLSSRLLDAHRHPFIFFASTGLDYADERWALRGNLTVRGTTRALSLIVEELEAVPAGLRLCASSRVDRYDFDMTNARGWAGRYLDLLLGVRAIRADAGGAGSAALA
jgi:polyisoprenoid-binding protein YceI